ncbi:hypothetical protein HHK36_002896 [Tetracentron sinense]|uniref:Uncharacterized protein n=1 Tax=Tetracentron sinense TaxID=13715 RepID=A0A835DN66_TETSI|nr:hypothetical protein HHK36_002896 [Tetracentron sinense]
MAKGRHYRLTGRRSYSCTLVLAMLLMISMVLLMLLSFGILSITIDTGNSPPANDLSSFEHKIVESGDGLRERGEQWTEIISWEPRAFIYHNFLSKDECEYLINLAKPHMEKSSVVDSITGRSTDSRVRTSSGMFLKRGRDKIIRDIEKRIADFSFIPVGNERQLIS